MHYTDLKTAFLDPRPGGGYGSLRKFSGSDPVLGTTAGDSMPTMGFMYDPQPVDEEEEEELDDFVDSVIGKKISQKTGGAAYVNDFGSQASTDARTMTKNQEFIAEQMKWDTPARSGISPFSHNTIYRQGGWDGPPIGGGNLATDWATDSAGAPARQTGNLGFAHPPKPISDIDDEPIFFNLSDFIDNPATDADIRSLYRQQSRVKKILAELEKD